MSTATEPVAPAPVRSAAGARALATGAGLPGAVVALVLLQLGVRAWVGYGFGFWQDDFAYLRVVADGLTWQELWTPYGAHLMPGQWLLVRGLTAVAPLSHTAAMTVALGLQALSGLLLARLLVLLCGRRAVVLLPLAFFLFNPLTLNALLWWAAGLQALPLALATIVAVDAHVRHLRAAPGSRGWAVTSVAAVAVGLLFWQKALLIPALLVLLSVLCLTSARGWRRPLAVLTAHPRLWAAHGVLVAGYLVLYLSLVPVAADSGTSLGDAAAAVWHAVVEAYGVSAVGGPWRAEGATPVVLVAEPSARALLVSAVLLAGVLLATVARNGWSAVRAWSVLAVYLALDVGLVVTQRLDFIGPVIARDPRYLTDAVLVGALALTLALTPSSAPPSRLAPVRQALDPLLADPVRRAVLVVVVAGLGTASSLVTTVALARHAHALSPGPYVDALRADLRAAPGAVVVDSPVPERIIGSFQEFPAVVSTVTAAAPEAPLFGTPTEQLLVVSDEGRLTPVDLVEQVPAAPGPLPDCGWGASAEIGTTTVPLHALRPVLRIGYYTGATVRAVVTAGDVQHDVVFRKGVHALHLTVRGTVRDVRISHVQPGSGVCLTDVVAGFPGEA